MYSCVMQTASLSICRVRGRFTVELLHKKWLLKRGGRCIWGGEGRGRDPGEVETQYDTYFFPGCNIFTLERCSLYHVKYVALKIYQ